MAFLVTLAGFVGRWFGVLVLASAVVGLLAADQTAQLVTWVNPLLGVIMFGMGLTLRPADFKIVATRPQAALVGVLAQFVVMPLTGWGLAMALQLPPELVVGMVLVGSAPGGTASNVIVYLARGDVALSVAMTSVSTLLAPLLTPLLVLLLAGSTLPVDAAGLLTSILQVVLVPVVLGLVVRLLFARLVERVLPLLPLVSVGGIVVVVAAVVGANADALLSTGALVVLAVVLHNAAGLTLGYLAAWAVRLPESARRAISVEVGMQNSGLAAALATTHFTPLAALPAALFSVWHNIAGALVAGVWSRRPTDPAPPNPPESAEKPTAS
ncbi:bile acid:sodium symporter family protein [Streptomonospora nanhaiensis]|uniref:BASS family bile acid:Na+ symporter n=1 Tax=Streptomonospora nanhaiensis TaxID=1323731 RepID=A0A853BN31_9ACTN|nr:bile acid:sodium symporter family protein [Streptomonospora nanhaiensis]MBV2364011.1 bile acid:sodium symporter family protein [Streptomonospora nanhaiensis]MBX9387355.1 bile acid:sodium symporter family protein [Streptomonospora nanhaiensis]NYI97009.1 BASS family bile acid:Na+ symporter [Streptomonospora nanhaiensis]